MLLLVFINNCLGVSERERKRERMRESEQCKCRELFDKLALQINASAMISNWMFLSPFWLFFILLFLIFSERGEDITVLVMTCYTRLRLKHSVITAFKILSSWDYRNFLKKIIQFSWIFYIVLKRSGGGRCVSTDSTGLPRCVSAFPWSSTLRLTALSLCANDVLRVFTSCSLCVF